MSIFLHPKPSPRLIQFLILLFLSILLGSTWFLLFYSHYPLIFSNVDWIYSRGGDLFQHQLGWEWFRQQPWLFPLGRIEAYGYPFGTYISFLDSIPLLAIPLKLLSPWLGARFQYTGIWNLASIIGQILVGMLILSEFTRSYIQKILGASLLVLSPPMIASSYFHDSLTAHWILLAAIWFIFLEYRHKLWRGAWIALFAAAMVIHIYFVAMLLPLWVIGLFFHYSREKEKRMIIVDLLAIPVVILLVGYCIGLFSLHLKDLSVTKTDYGLYSWNLNGFINPSSISSFFIKEMAVGTNGQYEGFSYLGLGNLLILPTAIFLFLQNSNLQRSLSFFLPFIIAAVLLGLFAMSQKAFLGEQPLWDFHLSGFIHTLFSMFRASGRFIWPVFYFLVLFGLISVLRYYRYPTLVLLFALLVQSFDLQMVFEFKKFTGFVQYKSPLQSEFWQLAANTNQHIILIPANWSANGVYEPFALYALQNELTLNWGYFSRADYDSINKYGNQLWEDLKAGQADIQTMYVFYNSDWKGFAQENLSDRMLICRLDGFDVVLSTKNKLVLTNIDLMRYCTVPPS